MNIFLSHAHEQAALADGLAIALRQEGHRVFLDTDALEAAEGFHAAIRTEIQDCDLFVFLVSSASLEPGGYALTEMGVARERWPNPTGHVLPVVVGELSFELIPPYLKAVTVLRSKGDPVAETLSRVAAIERRRRRRQLGIAAAAGVLLIAAFIGFRVIPRNGASSEPCLLDAEVTRTPEAGPRITTLDAGRPDSLSAFVVVDDLASLDLGRLTGPDQAWIIEASAADGRLVARFELSGCPSEPRELHDDATDLRLRLAPRR
jgi:TIR domain